ncbi:HD domain-containing protein [Halocynthiibacter namhaensis]|uniref:HD domain-containing protein n=1 Tax=Halocynthiibacter namhaensis TaxID=1290553 RepID=UPI000578F153|nr:HD domain-containing protein [Halocynthiibacter namhaensis]
MDRLTAQFAFLDEIDRLKSIDRSNCLIDLSRHENSAEHSWHLALFALILAPDAGPDVDINRAILMLLLHDIVEIDAGDHPIHEKHDWEQVAINERLAADRIYGLLPDDIALNFRATWTEFEACATPTAQYAKMLDHIQPVFQTVAPDTPIDWHRDIANETLSTGRASWLREAWPALWQYARDMTDGTLTATQRASDLGQRLAFLLEADQLKSVLRATPIANNSRRENSGEHSWHIALYAPTLADQSAANVNINRVTQMLIIHDIVEVDAGDAPIHGDFDAAAQNAKEQLAAARLFGLLPDAQNHEIRALWDEFEAAQSPDAVFAKSIDRVQPLLQNMAAGGGSWKDYDVTMDQIDRRVGVKVAKGAPELWKFIRSRTQKWFNRVT